MHEIKEQTELFHKYWSSVFRISEEDNRLFDEMTENRIQQEIYTNPDRYRSFERADLEKLTPQDPLLIKTTKNTIKNIIKGFKNKAPGRSGINRIILMNLPESAYEYFSTLTNNTLSMGYFPLIFKEGLIILILKPNSKLVFVTFGPRL